MLPKQVIFIRHAEKPAVGVNLSATGYTHAACWTEYFTKRRPDDVNKPQAIYAMEEHTKKTSNRAFETVTGLAEALDIPINNSFTKKEVTKLNKNIIENHKGDTVLVCWEHSTIPSIVEDLLSYVPVDSSHIHVRSWGPDPLAKKNDGSDFSSVWVLDLVGTPQLHVLKGCDVNADGECIFY